MSQRKSTHGFLIIPALNAAAQTIRSHFKYGVSSAKVIERSLRQHAKRAATAQHRASYGVDRAIAAGSHHYAARLLRQFYGSGGHAGNVGRVVKLQKLERAVAPLNTSANT